MGNEASSQSKTDPLPCMVICLDTLLYWSGQPPPSELEADSQKSAAQQFGAPSLVDGEILFAQVLIDGCEVQDGRIDRFPSKPVQFQPSSLNAELQLRFYLGTPPEDWISAPLGGGKLSPRLTPWSVVSAPVSKLFAFGAPLYTSFWLGLVKMEPHFGQGIYTSFVDAMQKAHMDDPEVPKVKVSVFRPSPVDIRSLSSEDIGNWNAKPDVRRLLSSSQSGLDCVEPTGPATARVNANQLEGLIRCVRECNAVVNKLQEATVDTAASRSTLVEDRNAINRFLRDIQRVSRSLNEVERRFAEEGLDVEISRIRSEIEGETTRHETEMRNMEESHTRAMKAEDDEIQNIKDAARQRAVDVSEEHQHVLVKHTQALENKARVADDRVAASRSQWEAKLARQLQEVNDSGQLLLSQAQARKESALEKQRGKFGNEASGLQQELRELERKFHEAVEKREDLVAECSRSSANVVEVHASEEGRLAKVRDDVEQMLISSETECSEAERARFAEVERLRAELVDAQKRKSEVLAQAEANRLEDIASMTDRVSSELRTQVLQMDIEVEELAFEHERALARERADWQNKVAAFEQELISLRTTVDQQGQEVLMSTSLFHSLEEEASLLANDIAQLNTEHEAREEEIQHILDENAADVLAAETEVAKKNAQCEKVISDLLRVHELEVERQQLEQEELQHQCAAEATLLKEELQSRREEASSQFYDIIKMWELKCEQSSQAADTAQASYRQTEQKAMEALKGKRTDMDKRVEAAKAKREEEVEKLTAQVEAKAATTEDESARLAFKLQSVKEERHNRRLQLMSESRQNAESLRSLLEMEHESRVEALTLELQQAHDDKERSTTDERREQQEALAPIVAEISRLRGEVSIVPEKNRENRSLTHELASERALLDVATSAYSDAEAMLASRSAAIQKVEADISSLKESLNRTQCEIEEECHALQVSSEAYSLRLAGLQNEHEIARHAQECSITDAQQRLRQEQEDAASARIAEIEKLESTLSEKRMSAQRDLSSVQLELQEDKKETKRVLAELQDRARANLDLEVFSKNEVLVKIQQSQQNLTAMRSDMDEAEQAQQRDKNSELIAIQTDGRKDLLRLMQNSRAELQALADGQQRTFQKLQAAHDSEREHLKALLKDQEVAGSSLQEQLVKSEDEADDVATVVNKLRKEISALNERHAHNMQSSIKAHEIDLESLRRQDEERQAQLESEADAGEQELLKQILVAESESAQMKHDMESLEAAHNRQMVAAARAVEHRDLELKQLQDKLDKANIAVAATSAKNADRLAKKEQQSTANAKDVEKVSLSYQIEQDKLQQRLDILQQELEVTRERLRTALTDVDAQEKQLEFKLQMEAEEQEKKFRQHRKVKETQHQSERETHLDAQKQAVDAQKVQHQAELDRRESEFAVSEKSWESIKDAPSRVEAAEDELKEMEIQGEEIVSAMKAFASQQLEDRTAELASFNALQTAKLEDAHAHYANVLALHRDAADASRKSCEEQMEKEQAEFSEQSSEHRESMRLRAAQMVTWKIDHEKQLIEGVAKQESECSIQVQRLRKEIDDAILQETQENVEMSGREAELRQRMQEELQEAGRAADEQVDNASFATKREEDAKLENAREDLARQVATVLADFEQVKNKLNESMQSTEDRQEAEVEGERERAKQHAENTVALQQDLERQVLMAQSKLERIEKSIEEKTKIHEVTLHERSVSEKAQIERTRRQLRSQQAGLLNELSEAQSNSQLSLRRMQDECFNTIDAVRQEALRDSEKRVREGTTRVRIDAWQAQQNYNVWHKRLEKIGRELEQLGVSAIDRPETHPLEFMINRIFLRLFKGLLEETCPVLLEDDLNLLFDSLPKERGLAQYAVLSKDAFREAVNNSLSFKRNFDARKFVSFIDQDASGCISAKDFQDYCQGMLCLDRETTLHIFKMADAASYSSGKKSLSSSMISQHGAIHEDDLVNLIDHPQARKVLEEHNLSTARSASSSNLSDLATPYRGQSKSSVSSAMQAALDSLETSSIHSTKSSRQSLPGNTSARSSHSKSRRRVGLRPSGEVPEPMSTSRSRRGSTGSSRLSDSMESEELSSLQPCDDTFMSSSGISLEKDLSESFPNVRDAKAGMGLPLRNVTDNSVLPPPSPSTRSDGPETPQPDARWV